MRKEVVARLPPSSTSLSVLPEVDKNIGTTHLTNGCCRLHPVEWNIGESVRMLVNFCLSKKVSPSQVRNNAKLLEEVQKQLQADGIEIQWPRLLPR
jgi:FAD dependent oxidoreductase